MGSVRSSRAPVHHLLAWRAGCECGNAKNTCATNPCALGAIYRSQLMIETLSIRFAIFYWNTKIGLQKSTSSRSAARDVLHVRGIGEHQCELAVGNDLPVMSAVAAIGDDQGRGGVDVVGLFMALLSFVGSEPKPIGSRRATPLRLFQHPPGHRPYFSLWSSSRNCLEDSQPRSNEPSAPEIIHMAPLLRRLADGLLPRDIDRYLIQGSHSCH